MGKYKKFSETRAETIILDEWVEMTWASSVRERYEKLGYEYTGHHSKFFVHIDDLAPTSGMYINVQCPVCKEQRVAKRNQVHYSGHTLCHKCTKAVDITDVRFGRWTVLYPVGSVSGHVYWVCQCECGTEKEVQGASLIKGHTTSCGCYQRELMSEKSGENSPVWVSPIVLTCEYCGDEYEARDSWDANKRKFCSKSCADKGKVGKMTGEGHPNWKGGKVALRCEWCNSEFLVSPSRADEAKFCSRQCVGKWRSEHIVGDIHPNWKPELTDEQRYNNRSSLEYKQYIKNVLERDDYTCQVCGEYGASMEVHHLYSHNNYPEYALDEEYGIALCKGHHKEFHSWLGGYGIPCTPGDFDRWMYETA